MQWNFPAQPSGRLFVRNLVHTAFGTAVEAKNSLKDSRETQPNEGVFTGRNFNLSGLASHVVGVRVLVDSVKRQMQTSGACPSARLQGSPSAMVRFSGLSDLMGHRHTELDHCQTANQHCGIKKNCAHQTQTNLTHPNSLFLKAE